MWRVWNNTYCWLFNDDSILTSNCYNHIQLQFSKQIKEIKIKYMFIQHRVRLELICMREALFKIRLLRKSVSNIRGPIAVTSQNIGPCSYYKGSRYVYEDHANGANEHD